MWKVYLMLKPAFVSCLFGKFPNRQLPKANPFMAAIGSLRYQDQKNGTNLSESLIKVR